jgi:hypothetical protein
VCRNYQDLLSESYRERSSRLGPQAKALARLNQDDAVLLDSLKDRAVRERLAFDVPVPVYIDHPLSGLRRPDEHVDFE